jgi:hypothetical protein
MRRSLPFITGVGPKAAAKVARAVIAEVLARQGHPVIPRAAVPA